MQFNQEQAILFKVQLADPTQDMIVATMPKQLPMAEEALQEVLLRQLGHKEWKMPEDQVKAALDPNLVTNKLPQITQIGAWTNILSKTVNTSNKQLCKTRTFKTKTKTSCITKCKLNNNWFRSNRL